MYNVEDHLKKSTIKGSSKISLNKERLRLTKQAKTLHTIQVYK